MLAEDLIAKLQALVAEHGNHYVENEAGEGVTVEFNDDDADTQDPVFVIY